MKLNTFQIKEDIFQFELATFEIKLDVSQVKTRFFHMKPETLQERIIFSRKISTFLEIFKIHLPFKIQNFK